MSEKQGSSNNKEKDVVEKPDVKTEVQKTPSTAPVVEQSPKSSGKSSSGIAWLALLLVIAVVAAGAWGSRELLRKEQNLNKRLANLEQSEGAGSSERAAELAAMESKWQQKFGDAVSAAGNQISSQQNLLRRLQASLNAQRDEMARFGATDKEDWLLAEAQYLLRLANQRLIMADDIVAAKALLSSADSILVELQDVTLHEVRAAVATDLAAVRAIPERDIEGIYLILAALIQQAGELVIFQLPEVEAAVAVEPAQDWQARLQQGYDAALVKLSDYIIIRRRDVPIEALMDPQWEGLVRQNLRMLLEQAQVALLSGNQALFRESLQRANHWLAEFFQADEAAAQSLSEQIIALQAYEIAVVMPDISRSLAALDEALERRTERGGDE